jgi:hypothetical protein
MPELNTKAAGHLPSWPLKQQADLLKHLCNARITTLPWNAVQVIKYVTLMRLAKRSIAVQLVRLLLFFKPITIFWP